jgi:cytochrome bd ubiquinol oxidase subunit II
MVDRLVRFFLALEFGGCERLIRANYSLAEQLEVMDMWVERPYLYVFPMIGAMAAILLAFSVRYRWDEVPFFVVTVIFLCAFGTLALSFWPYMIPFVLTIEEAAAPQSSLAFMFWGEGLSADAVLHCDQLQHL